MVECNDTQSLSSFRYGGVCSDDGGIRIATLVGVNRREIVKKDGWTMRMMKKDHNQFDPMINNDSQIIN